MMYNIFWNLIVKGIIVAYLNNILIFTQILEEYYRAVCRVMEVLAKHKLFLCLEKCEFNRQQIECINLVISENQVKMNSVKIARVCDWPTLQNHTELQAFPNFY